MVRKRANLTDLLNDLTFKATFDKYKLMAMNQFEWQGLPDGILPRHIESQLFRWGKCIFFRDPDMSYMALECQQSGEVNVYGDPVWYIAHGFNYNRRYTADECVVIENNLLRIPTQDMVMFYVNKIVEAERTMDVNIKANKTPVVFACDDKDVLTFKQIFKQVDGNCPALFADKKINLDSWQVFDTKAKFLCNDLMDYKRSVESDLLTFLGINNTPIDKKERLITDEATSNNQLIDSFCELQLEARQRACDQINQLFGLNVTVEKRNTAPVDNGVESVEDSENAE